MQRVWLLAFFFLSGISGLIYQVAWVRRASLTFGVSVYAYSAVLTAFMLGLAIGSYVMGRWVDTLKRPLRIYALVEVGIAVLATLTPVMLMSLDGMYAAVHQTVHLSLGWRTLLRLVMSVVVLTPTTFLIGATLPLMSRMYATHVGRVGSDVGSLYLVNTAGGALGCLLAGILLIRVLGLQETVVAAAALNLLVAGGALVLDRFPRAPERQPAAGTSVDDAAPSPTPPVTLPRGAWHYVAVAYALSGFAALGYEVAWARILYIHTLHAVYSFSLMLSIFLAGLAAGSAVGTWWLRRHRATLELFGVLELAIGVLAVLVLVVFARLPALNVDGLFGEYSVGYELAISAITMFPPTFLMGMLFPVVGSLYTRERTADVGLRIGTVTALNTVGAILGSLAAGFVLIPLLGLRNSTLVLAGVSLAIGAGALWLAAPNRPRLRWAAVTMLALPFVAAFVLRRGIYLGAYADASEYLVFYEEGVEATVAVLEVPERNLKVSLVNGRDEVPTDPVSMVAFRLLGHLPALLRPDARNALMLSFGNGVSTGTLSTHDIPAIDAVDLSRGMMEAAKLYSEENYHVLRNSQLRLHVEDARNFLLQTNEQYDIITADATHPGNASSWALFTREFYQLVQQRLRPAGVFMQWIPRHALKDGDYRAIVRTVQHVFPHVTLWSTGDPHTFVVATAAPLTQGAMDAALAEAAKNPVVRRDLGAPFIIREYLRLSEQGVREYVGEGRIVTDNNAYFVPMRGVR